MPHYLPLEFFKLKRLSSLIFEDGSLDNWEVIDEKPENLGDPGPSTWQIRDSQLGLNGKVLYQGSNIWGSAEDSCLMGTFTGTDRHYRVIMINDQWPEVPVDGIKGPFIRIDKRISDDEPWYEGLEVKKGPDTMYPERTPLHWRLEVNKGVFFFEREDGLTITASDDTYDFGYVWIQLYAQQAEFDNFTIQNTYPVDPVGKVATIWGRIKEIYYNCRT